MAILITIFFMIAPVAHAYLDPGTSSFLIQIIVGAVVGGAYFVKTFWKNIRSLFSKKQTKVNDETDQGNS